ncbi:uncharacterized protein LOC123298864 [Chrysoperla carnea]|uniref:uncharacterized protein LOC123298864 n=1 Tax=Chrysoperla carnea TaxID=189513 RepID=UPI001D08A2A9|nr:uncharacterized protein LOC123298864 [Chrysoperla carnea]
MYFSGMSESTLLLCNKTIKIDELIQKCHATDKKLKVSEKKNRQLTKKNEAKIKELVELQTNYESVQNHLFTAIQKCTDTQKALEKVQQQYKKCQEENEELTEQLETKHRKLMILEKEATLEALEKLKRKQSEDFMNKSKSKDPLYTLNIKVSTTDKEESDEMFCKNEMSFEESMLALSDKNNEKISTESNEKQHMPPPTGNPVMDNSILAPVSDENTNYPIKFTVLQLPQENNESPIVELAENYPSILIQVPENA